MKRWLILLLAMCLAVPAWAEENHEAPMACLERFMQAWAGHDTAQMLEVCAPSWREQAALPEAALFALIRNCTPVEWLTEAQDAAQSFRVLVLLDRNNGRELVWMTMTAQVVQEDGRYYVEPSCMAGLEEAQAPAEEEAAETEAPVSEAPPAQQRDGMSIVLREGMELRNGPGEAYGQSVFHNYPPRAGETAEVLGRCGDWLLVSYQGYWITQGVAVWSYLHVSQAPEYADVPEMAFDPRPNTLGVESIQAYADPEGKAANNWIPYREEGLMVLAVYGGMAYVDAINPYGKVNRCFIPVNSLADDPTAPELQPAPEGIVTRTGMAEVGLTYAPAFSSMDVISLDGGNWALMYETERKNGRYGVVTAAMDRAGKVLNSFLLRTKDGDEECTVEFMLPTKSGFVVNRFNGNEDDTSSQTIFTFAGKKKGTDTKHYEPGDLWDTEGTAHYRVLLGSQAEAEAAGRSTIPMQVRLLLGGGAAEMEIGAWDFIPCVLEGDFGLLVPVIPGAEAAETTRLMIFDSTSQLTAQGDIPICAYDVQLAPLADGRVFLWACDAADSWHGYILDPETGGTETSVIALRIPGSRDVALLAADEDQILLAVGGLNTQLLLVDAQQTLLAARTEGMLIHADTDGRTVRLLLLKQGQLRLETFDVNIP